MVVTALILWLGWASIVTSGQIGAGPMAFVIRTPTPIIPLTSSPLPTNTPYPTYTPHPTYTPYPTLEVVKIVEKVITKEVEKVVTKEVIVIATPASTPTPIIIVVTATPAPTPTPTPSPTPRFPAPRLIGPENGYEFSEGDGARIVLQWESVGPLAENEWYQVILIFFKSGEIQREGPRIKETKWEIPQNFYGQADKPERAYYWNVTVIRVSKDPDGTEMIIGQSPSSETWTFYWP